LLQSPETRATRWVPSVRVTTISILVITFVIGIVWNAVWPSTGHGSWLPSWAPIPAEDAYIVYRYGLNMSDGHGIVWNVGGPAVDGFTDFLWVTMIGIWSFIYGSPIPGVYAIGSMFTAFAALVGIFTLRKLALPVWPGALFGIAVIASPMIYHIMNGFGVPVYSTALGIALAMLTWILIQREELEIKPLAIWSLSLLAVGLARPEGSLFSGILIVALVARVLVTRQYKSLRNGAIAVMLFFILPAAIYALFRIFYFGDLFSAPFYVKTGSDGLEVIRKNIDLYLVKMLVPQAGLIVPVILAHRLRKEWRILWIPFVAVLVFFVPYLTFEQIQNLAMRFEYHTFYLNLLVATIAFAAVVKYGSSRHIRIAIVGCAFAWASFMYITPPEPQLQDDRWEVGMILSEYRDRDYVLASTEAGALPFISGWRTLDPFGLNDYHIAREGLDRAYWDSMDPAVVLNHTVDLKLRTEEVLWSNRDKMYEHMKADGRYEPVAVILKRRWFSRPAASYHVYFIRRDIPEFDELKRRILSLEDETYEVMPVEFVSFFSAN
jgi:arabinofuranosyltransferase